MFSGWGMGSKEESREKEEEEEEKVDRTSLPEIGCPPPPPCSNDVFSPSFPPFSLFSSRFSNGCRETLL